MQQSIVLVLKSMWKYDCMWFNVIYNFRDCFQQIPDGFMEYIEKEEDEKATMYSPLGLILFMYIFFSLSIPVERK